MSSHASSLDFDRDRHIGFREFVGTGDYGRFQDFRIFDAAAAPGIPEVTIHHADASGPTDAAPTQDPERELGTNEMVCTFSEDDVF